MSGTLRYAIIYKPKQRINWTMSLSGATNRAEYRKIGAKLSQYNRENMTKTFTRYRDGGSPTAIYAVRSAGIDPASGKEIFITAGGSYTFSHNYDDEVVVGDTRPDIEGVFGNTSTGKVSRQASMCATVSEARHSIRHSIRRWRTSRLPPYRTTRTSEPCMTAGSSRVTYLSSRAYASTIRATPCHRASSKITITSLSSQCA